MPGRNRFLFAAVVALAMGGCNRGPATTPVVGTVTFKGQPVVGATVILVPQASGLRTATGETDAEGKFKMSSFDAYDGAQPGNYIVLVSKMTGKGVMTEAENAQYQKDHGGKDPPAPVFTNELPGKYNDPAKSGLTAAVPDSGKLDLPLDLGS